MLAEFAWDQDKIIKLIESREYKDTTQIYKAEYWNAVNQILVTQPELITVYSMDMLQRAWLNTRRIWINLAQNPKTEPPEEPSLT